VPVSAQPGTERHPDRLVVLDDQEVRHAATVERRWFLRAFA
jgi:hypothetical protein